jgi:hypothetical protein
MLKIPHCLDNWLTDGGEAVSLTRRPRFTLQEDLLVLSSVRGRVNPRAIMQLEGLPKMKNSMTLLGLEPTTFRLVA